MNQREVLGRAKRVRVRDCYCRLGGHPGVADRLVARHLGEPIALANVARIADAFPDLHRPTEAIDPDGRVDLVEGSAELIDRHFGHHKGIGATFYS